MVDIFLSYKSDERGFAGKAAAALEKAGYTVWWDQTLIGGDDYQRIIHNKHSLARCVVVVWSHESIRSDWVRSEAEIGRVHNKLIPVRSDSVVPWPPFTALHTIDLTNWAGQEGHGNWKRLLSDIEIKIGHGRKIDETISKLGHYIHKLKAKDNTGRWAYYFILVAPDRTQAFEAAIDTDGMIDLEDYGKVIASCYGEKPNAETREFLRLRYGFNV